MYSLMKNSTTFSNIFIESVVDVSGAGDAFLAGVVYELKQGTPIVEACRTGAAMAALTIQSPYTVNEQINLEMLQQIQFTYRLRETNHAAIFDYSPKLNLLWNKNPY